MPGTITTTGKVSGYSRYWKGTYVGGQTYTKTWVNHCPLCNADDRLTFNPKGTSEGEITCGACGADYDCVTGQDKNGGGSRGCLTPASGDGTTTTTDGETESEEWTLTTGYDPDKPFQCYIRIEYALSPSPTAPRKKIQFNYTEDAPDVYPSFTGMTPRFHDFATTFNSINVIKRIQVLEGDWEHKNHYYLRQISLCHSQATDEEDIPYTKDEHDSDQSSCKMILAAVSFNKHNEVNNEELGASGRTILENINTLLTKLNYTLTPIYRNYRRLDEVVVHPQDYWDNNSRTIYCRQDSNIINIDNISYNPISNFITDSIKVFQTQTNPTDDETIDHSYVQSRNPDLVLRYGDCEDVESLSDTVSPAEAYYLAYTNDKLIHINKLVNEIGFTYTLTIQGVPQCTIHDKAQCVFDNNIMNDIKEIQSIEVEIDAEKSPMIRTKLGLGEVDYQLKTQRQMQSDRIKTKTLKSQYSNGATYSDDINYINKEA